MRVGNGAIYDIFGSKITNMMLVEICAILFTLFHSEAQVYCKICLKSCGLHEFVFVYGWICVVLFEYLNFNGLSEQGKITQLRHGIFIDWSLK